MIRLGEPPFRSIQGEGVRTGVLSIWVRFFGCNLSCSGFGQIDPADASTYKLPQFSVGMQQYKSIHDLPVFETGCDSGYSWSHLFKHLASDYKDTSALLDKINELTYNGSWVSPVGNTVDLCFTGGEPMLHQNKIVDIYQDIVKDISFDDLDDYPQVIQIETNGTQPLKKEFESWIADPYGAATQMYSSLCWNISPKLYYVSGEVDDDAWHPLVITSYYNVSQYGHLKFVINNDDRAWEEMNRKVRELQDRYCDLPVYVMPVGATKQSQENTDEIKRIAERAINEGYNVSSRIHAILFGNGIGT